MFKLIASDIFVTRIWLAKVIFSVYFMHLLMRAIKSYMRLTESVPLILLTAFYFSKIHSNMVNDSHIFCLWSIRRLWVIRYRLYHIGCLWGIQHIESTILWHGLLQHGIICLSGGKDLAERFLQALSLHEHFIRQDRRERALDTRHGL